MKLRILFIFIIIIGCSSTKKSIVGAFQQKVLPDHSKITLKSSNDFTYFIHNHGILGTITVYGKWKKLNDTIILNYDSIPPKLIKGNLKINYSSVKKKDSIAINIIDNNDQLMIGSTLVINGEENYINNIESTIYIKPKLIQEISYKFFHDEELITINLNKFIDTDIQLIVTPNIKRALIYDVLPEKFIIRDDNLYYNSEGKTYFTDPYIRLKKE